MSYVLVTRNEARDEVHDVNSRRSDRPLGFVTIRKMRNNGVPNGFIFSDDRRKKEKFDKFKKIYSWYIRFRFTIARRLVDVP